MAIDNNSKGSFEMLRLYLIALVNILLCIITYIIYRSYLKNKVNRLNSGIRMWLLGMVALSINGFLLKCYIVLPFSLLVMLFGLCMALTL